MATHTHNGFEVTPVEGSRRRADGGGYVVDVRSNDPRTTATYWTAPADQVLRAPCRCTCHVRPVLVPCLSCRADHSVS